MGGVLCGVGVLRMWGGRAMWGGRTTYVGWSCYVCGMGSSKLYINNLEVHMSVTFNPHSCCFNLIIYDRNPQIHHLNPNPSNINNPISITSNPVTMTYYPHTITSTPSTTSPPHTYLGLSEGSSVLLRIRCIVRTGRAGLG